jgi:hypothetical protein
MPSARSCTTALPEQTVRSGKADGTDRPTQYKSHLPGHSPPAKLGREGNFSPAMGARRGTK